MSIQSINSQPGTPAVAVQQTPAKMQSMPQEMFSHVLSYLKPKEIAATERVSSTWRSSIDSGNMQNTMTKKMYSQFFSFLNPAEVASSESVKRSWRSMINLKDEHVWKDQCRTQGVSTAIASANIEDSLDHVLGSYSSKKAVGTIHPDILSIISDYDHPPVNYKTSSYAIQGKAIVLGNSQINPHIKGTDYLPLRWSSGRNPEAFVSIAVYSDESTAACQAEHTIDSEECSPGLQGSWQDIHPRLPGFPMRLPLRLFINPDGSCKKTGDQIKLRYLNHPIILTCASSLDTVQKTKGVSIDRFNNTLAQNIDISLKSGLISRTDLEDARAAASDTWVSSD